MMTPMAGLFSMSLLIGCALAAQVRAPEPAGFNGAASYARKCAICHAAGLTGAQMLERRLGPEQALLDQRSDLSPEYIAAVVRAGILGMPPLTRVELPDGEMQAIIDYLTAGGERRGP